jgi:hypothetical protein
MSSTVRLLNRLLVLHHRSFPQYLAEAGLWRAPGKLDDETEQAFRAIVLDHKATARRVAAVIVAAAGGTVDAGSFPMEYTDKNDLALDYLVGEVIESERRTAAAIERILQTLTIDASAAREVVEEALGSAKAHIETLEGLANKQPA